MSSQLTPTFPGQSTGVAPVSAPSSAPAPYRPSSAADDAAAAPAGAQIARVAAALKRYKWLIGLLALVGMGGGVLASRLVNPAYQVQSSILLTSGISTRSTAGGGPITAQQALEPQGWIDLLKTNAIADSVVMKLALYVEPEDARDSVLFRDFQLNPRAQRFVPGLYELTVDGPRYTLRDEIGIVNEQGVVGDSIGRTAGFAWAPSKARLGAERTVEFRVRQPREASVDVLNRLRVQLAKGSNLIFLTLTGTAQQKPAQTLNAWNEQFVRIATDLKTASVSQSSEALNQQLATARQQLGDAERRYTQLRVANAALPSEAMAIASDGSGGGAAVRTNPALDNYTASRFQLESVRRERQQLEGVARTITGGRVPVEALLNVNIVATDATALPLRSSLAEVQDLDAKIRVLRQTLQDRTQPLAATLERRATLATQVIPQQVATLIAQLREREGLVGGVVAQGTKELQAIPQRTTQEEALGRDRDAAAQLFTRLQQRQSEAELARRSMSPDVQVLDRAVMPSAPTDNTLARLIGLGLAAGLGLGLGLSILLDRVDRRFRYPSQVTHGLGLQILGIVPEIDQSRPQSPERVAQIVEAFRSIRMNTRYACMPNPRVALTLTSPGPHEGKSLVASNLALSFAEGGWRTVIVDGDLRRGQLNATFDLPSGPGLIEYLEGTSLLGEILQGTSHENLALVATGAKHRRGPELLGTPRMQQLVQALLAEFDAVIVDSPPLGAGTDAYALGAATTNVALVLRRAVSNLQMAEAKLSALDNLPVQVVGAVLNEVEAEGAMYQYFSYDPDYVLVESGPEPESDGRRDADEPTERLPAAR